MRTSISSVAAAGLLVVGLAGAARAGVDVSINLGPPPPVIVFEHEPHLVVIPRTHVYYVPDYEYDLFRHGGSWYLNRDGYWYRADSYRGPFSPIVYERVPHAVIGVPARYHRHRLHPHGGPPGLRRKHGHGH